MSPILAISVCRRDARDKRKRRDVKVEAEIELERKRRWGVEPCSTTGQADWTPRNWQSQDLALLLYGVEIMRRQRG